jgi:hypothetical protein
MDQPKPSTAPFDGMKVRYHFLKGIYTLRNGQKSDADGSWLYDVYDEKEECVGAASSIDVGKGRLFSPLEN